MSIMQKTSNEPEGRQQLELNKNNRSDGDRKSSVEFEKEIKRLDQAGDSRGEF